MPRSDNQRLKLLFLRDYLLENTDDSHGVNSKSIISHLQNTHNIKSSRNTVYTDIDALEDYGMDIEYDKQTQGYRIVQRDFEPYELQLLVDSVQSSKFVTAKVAKEITAKLKRLASKHERKKLDRQSYVPNRIRNMNESAFYGLDTLHECIDGNRKISFRYFTYDVNKKKLYRKKNGGIYEASPYALMWSDNKYYLIAYEGKKIKHFRVDKMDNIRALEDEREGQDAFKALNLSERSAKVFGMFGGKEERVGLRFSNHLTGVVIDHFGKDVTMRPDGQKHFTVSVSVEVSPQFFGWVCGLGRGVKIVSPDAVVERMSDYVSSIAKMYQIDGEVLKDDPKTLKDVES